jgi:hypothetical protein
MNRPDPSSRLPRTMSVRDSGDPKIRAIRKELLLARADVERLEIAQASTELRHGVASFSWVRWFLPGLGTARTLRGLPAIGALLEHYPLLGSLASLVFAGPVRRTLLRHAKPLLKWSALGAAAWQAYKIWREVRPQRSKTTARPGAAPASAPARNSGQEPRA